MFEVFTDEQFAAWLAGFTDGEGYIGVEPTSRKGVSSVRVVLANTYEPVIREIRERLGFGAIRSQQQQPHWKRKFTWAVSSLTDAERFLLIVYPFLTIKRDAADAAFTRIECAKDAHRQRELRNEAVRNAASSGEKRRSIAERFNISPQLVSRICEGHTWPSERSHVATTRKRDSRGLFVPVE